MEEHLIVKCTEDRFAICNSCFARNYESIAIQPIGERVNELYEVHVGVVTPVVCKRCLARLGSLIQETLGSTDKKITFETEEDARPPP